MLKTVMGDQWTVNGSVNANFHLVAIDDNGNEVLRSPPHVVCLMPDADLPTVLATINADITTRDGLKWPAIEQADWDRISSHCEIEHTPDVKEAFALFRARPDLAIKQTKPVQGK